MTVLAALFMGISVTSVVGLTVWCYYRILSHPGSKPAVEIQREPPAAGGSME